MNESISNHFDEYEDYMGQTKGDEETICHFCQEKIKIKESYPKWNKPQKQYLVLCKSCFNKQGGVK